MKQERSSPPKVFGPRGYRIESDGDSFRLTTPGGRYSLDAPALNADNPFEIERVAIAPNADFIFGSRKVVAGESEMFLWVRQKNKSYKLLPETVNHWIVRRTKNSHRGGDITFVRLVRWLNDGNGVALASLYDDGRRNLWHVREIDLVRGRFGPERVVSENKLDFLI